jgi:trans-aconitate methyltransferase
MADVNQQLIDDHVQLDELLRQLQLALAAGEIADSHQRLDLFWARLAVHIRAEHLHLFPTVLGSLGSGAVADAVVPTVLEAESVVARLQNDHDFFMSELGGAVKASRSLPAVSDPAVRKDELNEIREVVSRVARRLQMHNQMEERQIYCWASMALTANEQAELAKQIKRELNNRPPRFTIQSWSNVAA